MPNEKRARQKANRQARLAELRRAQQRRRNFKRGGIVAAVIVVALVAALVTTLVGGGSGKKTKVASKGSSSTTSTTTPSTSTTTVAPLSSSKLDSYLTARTAPAKSASCSNPTTASSSSSSTTTTTVPAKDGSVSIVPAPAEVGFPDLDGSSPRYTSFSSAPPFCIDVDDTYTAVMKTTAGTIDVTLLPKYAPVTVNNFVFLAGFHYFNGMTFFRVIPGFATQGGSPANSETGTPSGPGYTIPDEYPKSVDAFDSGSLAMANTGKAHTGSSQFFFVDGSGGSELGSPSYTVFGQITKGLSVADKINAAGNSDSSDDGVPPKTTYTIDSVSIKVTPSS